MALMARVADSCAREAATFVDRAEASAKAMTGSVPDYSPAASLAQASVDLAIRACHAYAAEAAEIARDTRHSADMAADAMASHDVSVLERLHAGAISREGDKAASAANAGARMMCSAVVAAASAKSAASMDLMGGLPDAPGGGRA